MDNKLVYMLHAFSHHTRDKEKENYVVNAVWQRICNVVPDLSKGLLPVTQQYVKRNDNSGHKYGLIDLYFPQLRIAVECDEEYHKDGDQHTRDVEREDDIKAQTAIADADTITFLRVDAGENQTYEGLKSRIEEVADTIIARMHENAKALDWDFEKSALDIALEREKVSVDDMLVFRTVYEVSELFNLHYKKGLQRTSFWLKNGEGVACWNLLGTARNGYDNKLSDDWTELYEIVTEGKEYYKEGTVLYIFGKATDVYGNIGYRFIGKFKNTGEHNVALDEEKPDDKTKCNVYKLEGQDPRTIDLTQYRDFTYPLFDRLKSGNADIVYDDALCKKDNRLYIRFRTPVLESIFPRTNDFTSAWNFKEYTHSYDTYAVYEINARECAGIERLKVDLVIARDKGGNGYQGNPFYDKAVQLAADDQKVPGNLYLHIPIVEEGKEPSINDWQKSFNGAFSTMLDQIKAFEENVLKKL